MKHKSHLAAFAALSLATSAWAQTVVYDNATTYLNNGVANGGTVNVGGSNLKTLMIADDITLAPGSAGQRINSYTFSVRNFGGSSVSARPFITVYADNGSNAPGDLLYSGNFVVASYAANSIQTFAFAPPPAGGNLFTVPASGKIWAGLAFDNNSGATGATATQLDSLGEGAYGPATVGSSANTLFVTNAAGNYAVNNPVGHLENPGLSLGWRFVARVPVNITWNVAGGGTWNTVTNNWIGGSPDANKYVDGDNVTFDNAAGGTITMPGNVAPGSTTVNASSGTYTFSGSGTGILTGALMKQGFGRLVLANLNASTDDTTVSNAGSIGANGSGAHLTLDYPFGGGNVISGDLHIGVASAAAGNVAKVSLAQSNQIADNRKVYFDSPSGRFAYFSLRGNSETIAGIVSTSTGGAIENGNLNGAINTDSTLTLNPGIGDANTFSGIIRDADSGGGTGKLNIAVDGHGTQVLGAGGSYTYTGSTTVLSGRLRLESNVTGTSSVAVSGGTLELAAGGGSNRVLKTPSLSVTASGRIDLSDNKLIVTGAGATGTWTGSSYTGVTGLIKSGKGSSNNWNGAPGIVTSQSAAIGSNFTTLGVAQASDLFTSPTLWAGVVVAGADTLVMYTYGGDANLDGKLNVDDYIKIDTGIAAGLTGWSNGDFNYDGKINIDDYTQFIDANIATQGAAFPTSSGGPASAGPLVAAVPEPACLGLVSWAAAALLIRRRRRT